jgi:hypothetical protein
MGKEKLTLYGSVFWILCSLTVCYLAWQRDSLYLDKSEQFATVGGTDCPMVKWKNKDYCKTGTIIQACVPATQTPGNPCTGTYGSDCTLILGTEAGDDLGPAAVTVAGLTQNCSDQGSSYQIFACTVDAANNCVAGRLTGNNVCPTRTVKKNTAC